VDVVREALLAGAALARDQDGALTARVTRGGAQGLQHRRALRDHARGGGVDFAAQVLVLADQARGALDPFDDDFERFARARLEQHVRRAGLHGLDGGLDGALRRDQHGRHARGLLADALDEFHAVHARHAQVGEHEIGSSRCGSLECFRAVLRFERLVAERRDGLDEELATELVVVDDEDALDGHRLASR
jgi:hypothetical protein